MRITDTKVMTHRSSGISIENESDYVSPDRMSWSNGNSIVKRC